MTGHVASALIGLPVAIPLAAAVATRACRTPRGILRVLAAAAFGVALAVLAAIAALRRHGPFEIAGGWFLLDALAGWHLIVLAIVLVMSALFALDYFPEELRRGKVSPPAIRLYGLLWPGAAAALALVLVSNSVGLMWVGLEATTLLTAFLICLHRDPGSLEAAWKYILICSVGIALAFMGTILIAASAPPAAVGGAGTLFWSELRTLAPTLNPALARVGFVFLLVGYGTKAGLAPMHTWLPDAHSQAPAPVSALFSGFMINAGLYCLMRYLAILSGVPGAAEWARSLLVFVGLVSLVTAAAFILFQHDLKRLLAYHSVEHMGIISLGLGLGGLGVFGALWHVLNHSVCKTLGFCSAGRLGQLLGTHDMREMHGTLRSAPVWGAGLWVSFLALVGVAPFALFMSEFTILRGAIRSGSFWAAGIFLAAVAVVFVGAVRHAIDIAFGKPDRKLDEGATLKARVLVWGTAAGLLVLGVYLPGPVSRLIADAARIMGAP